MLFEKIQKFQPLSEKEKEFHDLLNEKLRELRKTEQKSIHYDTQINKFHSKIESTRVNNFEGEFSKSQHELMEKQLEETYSILSNCTNQIQLLNKKVGF